MVRWERAVELRTLGRADQRGALNLIAPEKTKAALRLVREGVCVGAPARRAKTGPWTAAREMSWCRGR
jgi:hypothetical protein